MTFTTALALDVAATIDAHTYTWANEAQLQAGIAQSLTASGFTVEREVRLTPRDRIDHLVTRGQERPVGIECKVTGPGGAAAADRVLAQLARYAASGRVGALLLVTTSPRHRVLTGEVKGVPLRIVGIGGLW